MDFTGIYDGVTAIFDAFQNMIDDYFNPEIIPSLVGILGGIVAIVGIWYGVRALLRAMRVIK